MSFWFVLWLLMSAALLYFFGWTLFVLYRQKKGWKSFAKRYDLRYEAGPMMQSPQVRGAFDGYQMHLFPSEHQSPDARSFRKLTAIEVGIKSALPFETAVANAGMQSLLDVLPFRKEIKPKGDEKGLKWPTENVIRADNPAMAQEYFTPARLKALQKMMDIKNAMVIFLYRKDTGILRIDLPDPLDKADKPERLMKSLVQVARKLELTSGEGARLKSNANAKKAGLTVLDDKDDAPDFTLEDD